MYLDNLGSSFSERYWAVLWREDGVVPIEDRLQLKKNFLYLQILYYTKEMFYLCSRLELEDYP